MVIYGAIDYAALKTKKSASKRCRHRDKVPDIKNKRPQHFVANAY